MSKFLKAIRQASKTNVDDASYDISLIDETDQTTKKPSPSTEETDLNSTVTKLFHINLPIELMIHVGQYLDVRQLNTLAQCNSTMLKLFFNIKKKQLFQQSNGYEKDECMEFERVQQLIWKSLVFGYYPKFEKTMNAKNWMHLLRRRLKHVKLHRNSTNSNSLFKLDIPSFVQSKEDEQVIENCEWIYKCPLNFEDLETVGTNVKFCNVCGKNVHKVDSMAIFTMNVKKGNCVAYTYQKNLKAKPVMKMGSCLPPKKMDKPPRSRNFNLD